MTGARTFRTPDSLYRYLGIEPEQLSRWIYKNTDCGAWAKADYREVESRGSSARSRDYRLRAFLTIGSIVEGSDAEVTPEVLAFPFTETELNKAIANVETEAGRLWREANEEED